MPTLLELTPGLKTSINFEPVLIDPTLQTLPQEDGLFGIGFQETIQNSLDYAVDQNLSNTACLAMLNLIHRYTYVNRFNAELLPAEEYEAVMQIVRETRTIISHRRQGVITGWSARFHEYQAEPINIPYFHQENKATCDIACRRMVWQALTGKTSTEESILRQGEEFKVMGRVNDQERTVRQEALWGIFNNSTIAQEFRTQATLLNGIWPNHLIERINELQNSCTVIFAPEVRSINAEATTHRIIITGIDRDSIHFLDPRSSRSTMSKHEFLLDWSQANFRGILIHQEKPAAQRIRHLHQ